MSEAASRTPWYRILYVQVLIAVAVGIALGFFFPEHGKELKPLGDGFIKLIKMMIAPIIFCTVVQKLSWDEAFREKGSKQRGISFDRDKWPHGNNGRAIPHGAVFSPP